MSNCQYAYLSASSLAKGYDSGPPSLRRVEKGGPESYPLASEDDLSVENDYLCLSVDVFFLVCYTTYAFHCYISLHS